LQLYRYNSKKNQSESIFKRISYEAYLKTNRIQNESATNAESKTNQNESKSATTHFQTNQNESKTNQIQRHATSGHKKRGGSKTRPSLLKNESATMRI
jgi:hypothetical protein